MRLHQLLPVLALTSPVRSTPANPIRVKHAVPLGNVTSKNVQDINRDGGWASQIGNHSLKFYADTQICPGGVAWTNGANNCYGFASNTLVETTADPLIDDDLFLPGKISDNNGGWKTGYPRVLCATKQAGFRLQMSNIVSLGKNKGVAWYRGVDNTTDVDMNGVARYTGVAHITWNGPGSEPTCEVLDSIWTDSEPVWGDRSAWYNETDRNMYLLGGLSSSQKSASSAGYAFAARVPAVDTSNADAYEYWNGNSWSSNRLIHDPNSGYSSEGWGRYSVLNDTQMGTLFRSDKYDSLVYVDTSFETIRARTSYDASGPWSDPVPLYQAPELGILYAASALTNFDPTGQSLVVQFSIFSPLYAKAVNIVSPFPPLPSDEMR